MHVYLYTSDNLVKRYLNRSKPNLDENEDCDVSIERLSFCKNELIRYAIGIIGYNIAKEEAENV